MDVRKLLVQLGCIASQEKILLKGKFGEIANVLGRALINLDWKIQV
jgi:hypothetical protein